MVRCERTIPNLHGAVLWGLTQRLRTAISPIYIEKSPHGSQDKDMVVVKTKAFKVTRLQPYFYGNHFEGVSRRFKLKIGSN